MSLRWNIFFSNWYSEIWHCLNPDYVSWFIIRLFNIFFNKGGQSVRSISKKQGDSISFCTSSLKKNEDVIAVFQVSETIYIKALFFFLWIFFQWVFVKNIGLKGGPPEDACYFYYYSHYLCVIVRTLKFHFIKKFILIKNSVL